jgi:peptidyl-prolyl cis-trans isomerase SurA
MAMIKMTFQTIMHTLDHSMKTYILSCFVAALAVMVALPVHAQQPRAGIAAIVNDQIITNGDVDSRVSLALQGARMKPDAQMLEQIRNQALQALIEEQIRLSEAKNLNVKVDPKELDGAFATLAAQNNLTAEQFKQLLSKDPKALASLQRQLETQIAWGSVVRRKLRPQINVSDTDIENYLAEQDRNKGKTEYEIAEIFLRVQNPQDEAGALKVAQNMIEQMRGGKQRFSVLAKQFSQGSEASKGGLVGWMTEGRLDPAVENALKPLKLGDVTDPIKMSDGYRIVFLKDKRKILSTEEENLKIQIKQLFMPAPAQAPPAYLNQAFAQVKQWQTQAVDCQSMQNLIKENPSPISKDLGMVRIVDLPAPVAAVVKDAPTGKIQEPLRGADGFLLVMVCGRQTEVEKEAVRDAAANVIGTERLNRLQRRYFRDLKDAAYVDIKTSAPAPAAAKPAPAKK